MNKLLDARIGLPDELFTLINKKTGELRYDGKVPIVISGKEYHLENGDVLVLKNEGLEYTGNPGIEINGKIHYPDNGDMLVVKNKEEGTSVLEDGK